MPIYEYQCLQCEHRSEVLQRMSDDPLTRCERCGGELKKLLSAPAFQFKGSGWYVTDYARKNEGKGESKGDGSSSDKPASKGDSDSSSASSSSESSASSDAGGSSKDGSSSKVSKGADKTSSTKGSTSSSSD